MAPTKKAEKCSQTKMKPYDLYRSSYLRYFGYAHVIGDNLRPLMPRALYQFTNASYAMAITYVCADVFDKASKVRAEQVARTTGDALIWQSLASLIIPGVAINRITWYTARYLSSMEMSRQTIRIAPRFFGLFMIPLIVEPIDDAVDYIMDNTYRKWVK